MVAPVPTSDFPLPTSVIAWSILFAPLAAAVLILLFGVHRRRLSACLAIGALLASFVCTGSLFLQALGGTLTLPLEYSVQWIALPNLVVPFGILIDPLSLLMTLVVTGVGSAIFLY